MGDRRLARAAVARRFGLLRRLGPRAVGAGAAAKDTRTYTPSGAREDGTRNDDMTLVRLRRTDHQRGAS